MQHIGLMQGLFNLIDFLFRWLQTAPTAVQIAVLTAATVLTGILVAAGICYNRRHRNRD